MRFFPTTLYLVFLCFGITWTAAIAQDCPLPSYENGIDLHANKVQANFPASGHQLWNPFFNRGLIAYDENDQPTTTLFAHGIWLGGIDPDGEIRISAAQYGAATGNSDFYPGPLDPGTALPFNNNDCDNFDRAWTVTRSDIEAMRADFAEDFVIDNPIPSLMAWPGVDNPHFEEYNGFPNPRTSHGSAPFYDFDLDTIYNPLNGDYPIEPRHYTVPEQLVWTVFNTTSGPQTETSAPPFVAEIQSTAWAYNCTDNPLLNNTIFVQYKVINRTTEMIDSVRFGLWTDFSLGCPEDDLIGCAPDLNTFYAYNQDNLDGPCPNPASNGGLNPPVQAVTFLNFPLEGFIYTVGEQPAPVPLRAPNTPQEYFNVLNARFSGGEQINAGGSGYAPVVTNPTNFVFSGDPNDPTTWSAFQEGLNAAEWRTLGTTSIDPYPAQGVLAIDIAYSYHRTPGADHLENVTNMLAEVANLQQLYNNAFEGLCEQPQCPEDCIWTGDLNADGIANYVDRIALSFGRGATGPERAGPYVWAPRDGLSWGENQVIGPDLKHLDANGDGIADPGDFQKTMGNYNRTHSGFAQEDIYPEGPELSFTRSFLDDDFIGLSPGETITGWVRLRTSLANLRAIAFELEYDPVFFAFFNEENFTSTPENLRFVYHPIPGAIDCAAYLESPNIPQDSSVVLYRFFLQVQANFPPNFPMDETEIRFKNIRGWRTDGTEVNLGATTAPVQIVGITTNTQSPTWSHRISLSPNPTRDLLRVDYPNLPVDKITLFDLRGTPVSIPPAAESTQINVSELPPGTYFLQITIGGEQTVKKFIKQD